MATQEETEVSQLTNMFKNNPNIFNDLAELEEASFRENLLPLLLNDELKELLPYYIGFTGSPFKGIQILRDGEPVYKVPALLSKRFTTSTISEINSDGFTEENTRLEQLSARSPRLQKAETDKTLAAINGVFSEVSLKDNRAAWIRVFEENDIDYIAHYGLDKEPVEAHEAKKENTEDWGSEEL